MRRSAATCLFLPLVAAFAGCASPAESPWTHGGWQTPQNPRPTAQGPTPWAPPIPNSKDKTDWIQLKSGEWLKGEILSLRRRQLEFDSEEMNRLTIDWADVKVLRSPRINAVSYGDRSTVKGTLLVQDDVAIVTGPGGETRFFRRDIYSIVSEEERELNYWDGQLTLGLAAQSGNVNQVTMNTQAALNRRTALSRLALNYTGYYSEVEDVESANNHRARGAWNLYLTRRLYVTPLSLDFFSDKFQNIQYQLTPAAGLGYAIVDEPSIELDVGAGVGWRYTRFESVEVNEEEDDSTVSVLPLARLDWDVTKKVEIELRYLMEIGVPETRDTNQHLVATLSVDITGNLDLDVTFQWDRVGAPERDSSGSFPDNDDFRTTVGLSLEF